MSKTFKIKGKLWKYPSMAAWYMLSVDKATSAKIKKLAKKPGNVKVKVTINKDTWATSLFPTKKDDYMFSVKSDIRKKNKLDAGDMVEASFTLV